MNLLDLIENKQEYCSLCGKSDQVMMLDEQSRKSFCCPCEYRRRS